MKFMHLISIILIFVFAVSACQSISSSNVLFSDDFSDTGKKWDQVTDTSRSTDYYNNAYRIVVNDANYDTWANPKSESFTDVQIEVDATKNGGPDYNDFGIICRYTGVSSFYYAVISSDGYYSIMKQSADGGKPISQAGEQFSDKIKLGTATNHIRFDCVGSTLTLFVNGSLINQQTDADYTDGNVGLLAGTYTDTGTDILFDNFIVYKP